MKRIFTIIFLLYVQRLVAQEDNYYFEKYSTRDGLSHNWVNCLFKDSRGLIWVGTDFGLNMYDGNTFTPFFHIPGDTNSLVHSEIHSIAEDSHHDLWIGTQNGVSCFNLLTRKFINYSRQNKGLQYLDIEHCFAFPVKDGTIWIGHGKGIIHLDPATQQTHPYFLQLSPPQQYRNRYVHHILEDEKNNLWAATSFGVYRLKKGDTAFQSFRFPDNFPREFALNACTRLAADKHGSIYCGTWNAGIIFFDRLTNQFKSLKTGNVIDSLAVFDLYVDNEKLWVASSGGLYSIVTPNLEKETNYSWQKFDPGANNLSTPYLSVSCILPVNNFLWLITNNGLLALKTSGNAITNYSYSTINNWTTLSIVESGASQLQIANGLALMSYDINKKKATKISELIYPGQLIPEVDGPANGYWLTARPGLYRLDKNLHIQELITHRDANNEQEFFGSVYEDAEAVLWLSCGRKGLRQYDTKIKKWSSFFDKKETHFRQITGDQYGNVWLASTSLIRYNRNKKKFENILIKNPVFDSTEVNNISSIYPTGNNIVWIGTNAGLYYFDYNKDSVFNIPLPANISPWIYGVVANKNHLLLDSKGGFILYDIRQKTFKIIGEADGFTGQEMSSRFTVLKNGNFVAGYNGGFAIIDPSKITASNIISTPQFTGINIDNTSITDASVLPALKYNQSISFSFVSPSYDRDENVQYAYQLQPVDKEWNLIGNNTSQRFTNLPAGKYTFVVKAANASGFWNETTNSFSFIVRPSFWKTWWFITLLTLSIVGVVYALYRYRVNQLLRMEKMRTRIATDLHDDIGATLSSISFYSEAVRQKAKEKLPEVSPILEKMGETSRSMVSSMSDIVWAINPGNDDMGKMLHRMQSYAAELCALKNVILLINADEHIRHLKPQLEQRKNIYLIFKEALNNALKYSGCARIWLTLNYNHNLFTMQLKDDGKGFDTNNEFMGNGLTNMQRRAKEINGILSVISGTNEGTIITMTLKIT